MKGFTSYLKIFLGAVTIAIVGVFVVDYFAHRFFSSPMETTGYFWAKATFFFIFSLIFLAKVNLSRKEFFRVVIAGIVVSALWGMYYNVFPALFHYYPYGLALSGLTFWGMGTFGTGLAFGTVHTLAFVGGYYLNRLVLGRVK